MHMMHNCIQNDCDKCNARKNASKSPHCLAHQATSNSNANRAKTESVAMARLQMAVEISRQGNKTKSRKMTEDLNHQGSEKTMKVNRHYT